MNTETAATDYVRHGWALVRIARDSKGPTESGWNTRPRCIIDEKQAATLSDCNVGLAHAYSGTCAIDFDNLEGATMWLNEKGIDASALLSHPDAVRISSGRPNRAKLLYRLTEPLRSVSAADYVDTHGKKGKALEFRCATASGLTVQDLLPPSVHPVTGAPYRWEYNDELSVSWQFLPEIPAPVLELWELLVARPDTPPAERAERVPIDQVRAALFEHDPSAPEAEWHRCLMAVHWETQGSKEGLDLADEWSKDGKNYTGRGSIENRWRSWKLEHANPITFGSLRRVGEPAAPDEFDDLSAVPTRPVILVNPGKLHENAQEAEHALANEVYVRDRQLVRIGVAPDITEPGVERDANQAVIIAANAAWTRRRLMELRRFIKYDGRAAKLMPVNCPRELSDLIVGTGDWPTLRPLETIARAPFLRADGSLCETSGYDRQAKVFYEPNGVFASVSENPSREEGRQALAALLKPFEEFPFATVEARAAFAAAILTEVTRSAVGTAPCFVFSAPEAGTGKSMLAEMPSRIVHGTLPAMRPWAGEEELRKTLFSSLLAADRTIAFDNLQDGTKIRSSVLCAFLTSATYSDRKLGVNETPTLPNRSTVYMTGNNITPTSDLARRSLVIRLNAQMDPAQLRQRMFEIPDLRAHVSAHRAELLVAALTVLMAHRAADYPRVHVPLPSFEGWSRLVRDALTWLDLPDPVVTQSQEADDESLAREAAFALVAAAAKDADKDPFTASDLASWSPGFNSELAEALMVTGCADPHDAVKVGYWLRRHKEKIAGGWKLTAFSGHAGTAKWSVRRTSV